LNGSFQLSGRTVEQRTTSGKVTNSDVVVERPNVSGDLEVFERKNIVETDAGSGSTKKSTTYRKGIEGNFYAAAQEMTEVVRRGNQETTTSTEYNAANSADLELAGRTVTEVQTQADGSKSTVVNVFGLASPGRAITADSGDLKLREQQIIERKQNADGSYVETTGVRRTSLSDPSKLGAYQAVSEVVCQGDCSAPADGGGGKK
jgi:hypothetical protein